MFEGPSSCQLSAALHAGRMPKKPPRQGQRCPDRCQGIEPRTSCIHREAERSGGGKGENPIKKSHYCIRSGPPRPSGRLLPRSGRGLLNTAEMTVSFTFHSLLIVALTKGATCSDGCSRSASAFAKSR